MNKSRTHNTFLNTVGGMLVKIVSILTAFLTRTIFIRTLGIEYAGIQGVFTDILTVLSFAEMGVGSAIVYALYKPIAEHDDRQISKLMNAYKKIYRTISLVIISIGVLLLPYLKYIITDVPSITEDIRTIYVLYLLNTALSYLLVYKASFLTAAQKDYLVSKIRIIISTIKAVVECTLLLIFKDFLIYLLFSIIIGVVQNILIAKIAEKEYPILKIKNDNKLEKNERDKLISDVKALFLYKVSGTILNGTDSIVVSSFIGTSIVGILGNYNLVVNQIYSFIMQIFTATSASIGNLAVTSSSEHQSSVFDKMLFLCFWIYCFCTTSLWILITPFMKLWQGEQYLFTQTTLVLLLIEFYMRGMLSPITQFRTSNGLFIQGKYRPLIMAIINIVLSIVFVKKNGVAGVILGTIISRITTQIWYDPYLIYKNVFNKSVVGYYITYIKYFLMTIICCIFTKAVLLSLKISSLWGELVVGMILCIIIPNISVIIVWRRTDEFKEIIGIIRNIVKRKL